MNIVFILFHLIILISLLTLGEFSIIGPYTEIKGGVRPIKKGDTVTHVCITEGGNTKPTLKWYCLTKSKQGEEFVEGNKVKREVTINITDMIVKKNFSFCSCHANHSSWNTTRTILSRPALIRTVPIIGNNYRKIYSAVPGKPVTIKVTFYAYPEDVSVIVNKIDYMPVQSYHEKVQEKEQMSFNFGGEIYHTVGEAVYWKIDNFTEIDYGQYIMQLINDEGIKKVHFNISSSGPPSEPYNVTITDVNYEGFTATFVPGYDGGYPQTFTLVYWPVEDNTRQKTIKSTSDVIEVRRLLSSSKYHVLLYAENVIGRSLDSDTEPYVIKTNVVIGEGSHQLIHVVYGIGILCILVLVGFIANVVHCCKQKTGKSAIKVPPILTGFRKSRGHVSDVRAAVSRSNTNIANRTDNGSNSEQEQDRSPAASLPGDLNYLYIEMQDSTPRTPTTNEQRNNTNLIQIDIEAPVPAIYENNETLELYQNIPDENSYGKIYF